METRNIILLLFLHQTLSAGAVLKMIAPSFQRAGMGSDVRIPCTFTVDKPPLDIKQLAVSWRFQEVEIQKYQSKVSWTNPRVSINTERIKDGDVALYISNATISDGGIYKCLVSYGTDHQEKEIRLDIEAPPEITITESIVVISRQSILRAAITGFYPVDIDVKWFRSGEILNNYTVSRPQRNPDGTYSVNSTVTIKPTEEDTKQSFSCRVQHESLSGPLHKDFHVISGAVPSSEIISSTLVLNQEQELICRVWGFYPESIRVNWFLNGSLMESTKTRRINSSAVESIYQFLPTKKNWGQELSCEVEHETLSKPLVRKLLVEGKDLTVRHRVAVVISSVVTVLLVTGVIILVYVCRYKNRTVPKVREITRHADGAFSLDVDHFHPKNISFSWNLIQPPSSSEKQQLQGSLIMSENQDGTFNATSTCENLRGKVKVREPYTIQVQVTHPKITPPVCKEWTSDLQDPYKLKPVVSRPLELSLRDPGEVLCSLNLETFYPKDIEISWICESGQYRGEIKSEEKYHENPDQSYNAESVCEIPGDFLKSPESKVIVRWKHETKRDWESKELSVRDPGFPWCPTITEMSPLLVVPNHKTTLKCTVSGYFPDVLTVTWFMKNVREETVQVSSGSKYKIEEINREKMDDNTYTCTSMLYFTPTTRSEEQEFICQVSHPSLEEPIERSTGPLRMKVSPTVTDPISLSLCGSREVLCSLYISKFYPKKINITWTSGKDHTNELHSTKKIIQIDEERTYDALSECKIQWDRSLLPVCVTWHHESMENPEYKQLKITDFPWRPEMGEIEIPALLAGSECRIRCDISNYFPDDLRVTWCKKRNGREEFTPVSPNEHYQIPDLRHEKQRDNTYKCKARLVFTPSLDSHEGAEFLCRVEHPSLERPIEKRTEPLKVMVAPVFLAPVTLSLCGSGEVLCVLTLTRFCPQDITITWTPAFNQKESSMPYKKEIQCESDHLYNVRSECKIPWDHVRRSVRVTWDHVSMAEPEYRDLHITDFPWRPEMGEIEMPALLVGSECRIQCEISNYFPDDLRVTWCKKRKESQEFTVFTNNYQIPGLRPETQRDITYRCTARLVFIPSYESDEGAEFLCRVEHPSLKRPIEKRTKPLQVMVAPVFLAPVTLGLCDSGEVLCVLTLTRFYPKDITITWTPALNHNKTPISNKNPIQCESDHLYSVTSQCKIPWDHFRHSVRVTWKHVSMAEPEYRELRLTDFPWCPVLGDVEAEPLNEGSESKLRCNISSYFPDSLTVTWFKKEKGRDEWVNAISYYNYKIPDLRHEKQRDITYRCTASLVFIASHESDEGAEFLCRVEHPSLEGPIERRTEPLQVKVFPPQVDDIIIQGQLQCNKSVTLQCKISNFFPDKLTVTWHKKQKGSNDDIPVQTNEHYQIPELTYEKQERNNTYKCTACLVFTPSYESDKGAEFLCRVEHPRLERPIERRTKPLQVKVFPPRVDDIIVPRQSQCNESVTLQCKIWNFYPGKLTVTWVKTQKGSNDDIPVQTNEHYQIPDLTYVKQKDNTYSCTACLVFTPSLDSDEGAEFLCRVEHPNLERPIERRTEPLQVKGCPPHVGNIIVPGELRCDQLVGLQCEISEFSPDVLTVTWIKNQNGKEEIIESQSQGYYYIPDLRYEKQRDNTYSCTASLVFFPSYESDQGAEFLCRVEHPSLERLIERRTDPLQLIKTRKNLENNRSEEEEGESPPPSDGDTGRGSRGSTLGEPPEMCERGISSNQNT